MAQAADLAPAWSNRRGTWGRASRSCSNSASYP